MLVLERAEGHDIGPVLLKQLEILRVIEVEGLVVRHGQLDRPLLRSLALEDLLGDQGQKLRLPGNPQQQVQVDVAFHRFRQHRDGAIPFLVFRHRQQPELALRNVELGHFAQRSQDWQLGGFPDRILDTPPMTVRPDVVEEDAGDSRRLAVRLEPQGDGSRGLGHVGDIHDEHHRRLDDPSDLGRTSAFAIATAVKEAHHPFNQRQVRAKCALRQHLPQRAFAQHPGVEIAARPAAHMGEVGGIDIVGAHLERLDRQPAGLECRNQTGCQDGLTYVARRPGDNQPWSADFVQHPCLALSC